MTKPPPPEPPKLGTTTAAPSHIGVPNDYKPPPLHSPAYVLGPAPPLVGEVRYSPGDEYEPLNHPDMVLQLQAQLAQLGFLNPDNIRPGVWDAKSASAYKQVLAYANQNGIDAQTAMMTLSANPTLKQLEGGSGGSSSRAPLVVQQTNPLDIAATAQDSAQKLLGRNLTDAELKPFIEQYQALESSSQTKAYKVGGTGKNATIVNPPSSGAFAEDYFRKNFGPEEMGYAAVERMNEFYSLLGSPVSNG